MIGKKGISPIVATVLLIAVTVAIVGIVATFTSQFTQRTTEQVGSQSKTAIDCSYGAISLGNLKYLNNHLSGIIENRGQTELGNISMNVIFQNSSLERFDFCTSGSSTIRCTGGNLSLLISEQASFNVTIGGSNYNSIRVFTNCTGVGDIAQRGDVLA